MGPRSYIYRAAILAGLLSIALLPASFALAQKSAPPSLEEMWRMIKQQQVEIDTLKAQNAQLQEQLDQVPKAMAAAPASAPAPAAGVVDDKPGRVMEM